MKSKILDAVAYSRSNEPFYLINTAIDIEVDWDLSVLKKESSAHLYIIVNNIKGSYSYTEKENSFEKTIIIKFSTNSDWKIEIDTKSGVTLPISPVSASINVYSKTIKLQW